MRIKKSDLKWYVLQWDPNQNKTVSVNILNGLAEDLAREVRNGSVHNKSILREYLKRISCITIIVRMNASFLYQICQV